MLPSKSNGLNKMCLNEEIQVGHNQNDYISRTEAVGLAHEIRNPLTAVKGFLQLLKPYMVELGKEQYADLALEEINRANDLLFDFMNSAKPKFALKKELSLSNLLRDIALLYESEAILRNIQVTVCIFDENLIIKGNEKQLKQVFGNMIQNAIEAILTCRAENDRQITISLKSENSKALITIEDSGAGILPEAIEHIFKPFFTTKTTGTGIGLPFCKKIMEEHNGNLKIKSSSKNGTAFIIELPLSIEKSGA